MRYCLIVIFTDDRAVLQMVSEMQQALNRIPPEVASTVMLHSPRDEPRKLTSADGKSNKRNHLKENEHNADDKVIVVVKPHMKEAACQTPRNNYETEKLQKHLEESSAKIETACKQMEAVCTRLKSEKEELEIMLRAERETVKFLRKQMEEADTERVRTKSIAIRLKIHANKKQCG